MYQSVASPQQVLSCSSLRSPSNARTPPCVCVFIVLVKTIIGGLEHDFCACVPDRSSPLASSSFVFLLSTVVVVSFFQSCKATHQSETFWIFQVVHHTHYIKKTIHEIPDPCVHTHARAHPVSPCACNTYCKSLSLYSMCMCVCVCVGGG
jgi:hypothetical protein